VIYAYAVVRAGCAPEPTAGIDGAPVELLSAGTLAAVCSSHPTAGMEPDPNHLAAHNRVTTAMLATGAVVPLRFGTTFPDDGAVREALVARARRLEALLRQLEGKVEFGLRACCDEPPAAAEPAPPAAVTSGTETSPAAGTPGRSYLESLRRSRRDPAGGLAAPLRDLHHTLSGRVAAAVLLPAEEGLVAAYLVGAAESSAFRAAVGAAADEDLHAELSGPWAPYTFVTAEASGA